MIRAFVAHFEDALQSCRSATRKLKRLVRARVVETWSKSLQCCDWHVETPRVLVDTKVDASGFDVENLRYLQVQG